MYMVGAGLVIGSVLLFFGIQYYPAILGELIAYFIIFGGIGFVVYKIAKKIVDKNIAIVIGTMLGLISFILVSYAMYMQNS